MLGAPLVGPLEKTGLEDVEGEMGAWGGVNARIRLGGA